MEHITHKNALFVRFWRVMDLDTKILNVIPYSVSYTSSDKIFNLTLKFELDLTIFC